MTKIYSIGTIYLQIYTRSDYRIKRILTKHIIGKCWAFKQAAKRFKKWNYWVIHYQSCLQLVVSRQQ